MPLRWGVVQEEMDEENQDDKEEQSEEGQSSKSGTKKKRRHRHWLNERNMNVHTFRIEVGADIVRPKVCNGGRR